MLINVYQFISQDARKKRSNRSSEPCAKNTADEVPTPEQNNLDSLSVKSTQSPDSAKIIDTNIPSVETYEDLLTRKYKLLSIQNDKDSAKSVLKFRKDLQEQVSNSRRHLRMQAQDLMKRNRAHWPIADFHTADVRRIYGRPIVYKANLHPRPTECTKNVVTLPRQLTPDNATAAATTRPTTPPPQPRAPPRKPTQMEMAIYWDISSEDKQQLSQMGHSVGQITYKNTDTSMEPKSKTEVVEQKPVEIPKETRSSIDDQEHDQHNTSVSNTESNHNGDSGSDRKIVDIEEKKLLQLDCSSNKNGTNPSLSASNESSVGDSKLVASIVAGRPIAIPDSPQNSTINTERTNTSRIVREYDRSSPNDRQTEISRKVVTHVNCRNNDKQVSRGSKPVESETLKQQRPHTTGHRCFTQKPAKWQQSESEEMKRTAHQRRCLCLNRIRRPTSTPLEGYRSRLGKLRSAPMRHRSGQERWRFVTTYALTNSFVHKPRRFRSLQRALYH